MEGQVRQRADRWQRDRRRRNQTQTESQSKNIIKDMATHAARNSSFQMWQIFFLLYEPRTKNKHHLSPNTSLPLDCQKTHDLRFFSLTGHWPIVRQVNLATCLILWVLPVSNLNNHQGHKLLLLDPPEVTYFTYWQYYPKWFLECISVLNILLLTVHYVYVLIKHRMDAMYPAPASPFLYVPDLMITDVVMISTWNPNKLKNQQLQNEC